MATVGIGFFPFTPIPVHSTTCSTDTYKSVLYLPGIAHLAKGGYLRLKTSTELRSEEYRLSPARLLGGGYYDYSLFRGVRTESLDFFPFGRFGSLSELASKDLQRARLSASDDVLYRGLLAHLKPRMSQDAWHIRTAEMRGCYCFLTMDFDLLRTVEKVRHLEPYRSLRTKVLSPEQFGKSLKLNPIPAMFFSYHDASFPVRPDLHQPGSQRAKW